MLSPIKNLFRFAGQVLFDVGLQEGKSYVFGFNAPFIAKASSFEFLFFGGYNIKYTN